MKIQLFELSELISDMAKNKQDIDHCSFAYSHIIVNYHGRFGKPKRTVASLDWSGV